MMALIQRLREDSCRPIFDSANLDRPVEGGERLRRAGAVALPLALALIAVHRWFEPGRFIAAGDIPPFIRTGFRGELFELWNHRVSGAGSATSIVGHSFEVGLLALTELLGASAPAAQRIQFALVATFAISGTVYFARALTDRPLALATAGTVSFFNPLSLSLLPNPLPLVAVGTAAILGGLILRAGQGRKPSSVGAAFALLPASYLSLNPPLLAVLALWVVAMLGPARTLGGPGSIKRSAAFLAQLLPPAVLVNLWWLVPTAFTLLGDRGGVDVIAVTDISAWAWTHARASLANAMTLTATWTWGHPEYAPWAERLDAPPLVWMRYGLPAAAFAAPLVGSRRSRRVGVAFLPIALAAIFLIKGLHGPLTAINRALYLHVPGFWLFREPVGKFGVAVVLVYAGLGGLTVQACWSGLRARAGRGWATAAAAAALMVPVVAAFPLLDGSVIGAARPPLPDAHVRVPEGWYQLAKQVNKDRSVDKVLVLPLGDFYQMPTTWGFYGTDSVPGLFLEVPVIQRNAGAYFRGTTAFDSAVLRLQNALLAHDLELAEGLLQDLSVTHVLLRHDFNREFPGRVIADPSHLGPPLEDLSREWQSFDIGTLYAVAPPMRITLRTAGADVPLRWKSKGSGEYVARLPGPAVGKLILRETFSPDWRLSGTQGEHEKALGYANAWRVRTGKDTVIRLVYMPSRVSRLTVAVSVAVGIVAAAFGVFLRLRARRE